MNKTSKTSFYNALGVLAYISLVSLVMSNAGYLFAKASGYLVPVAMLSLFTLSAAVVGGLVLGKPVLLYLDNQKKDAVSLFLQTLGWLAGITVILFIALALHR